jgi:hypothetical protein
MGAVRRAAREMDGCARRDCDHVLMGLLADGELVVVETEDDLFLGTAEVLADVIVVRSGFVGRPVVLAHEDVMRVTPFSEFTDPAD